MIKVDDLAHLAGYSVAYLEYMALAVEEQRPFVIYLYENSHGEKRRIVRPADSLSNTCKNLHRALSVELNYEAPSHVHGFVKGKSIKTNAREHLAQGCVLRVDLREFFPSISSNAVEAALVRHGLDEEAANLTARIITIDGVLPIGFSSSPLISNLVFFDTDRQLTDFAETDGIKFTRYVDDLIFSGELVGDETLASIRAILEADGWSINDRKTAFMRRGGPQYVTGLYVGREDGPHLPRRIKRQMRLVRHMIQKLGYEEFLSDFCADDDLFRPRRLRGWARHAASIEPDFGYDFWRFLDSHIPEGFGEWPEFDSPAGIQLIKTLAEMGIGTDTFEGGAQDSKGEES